MANSKFYDWLDRQRKFETFEQCVPLTERQLAEQYDLELVIRFFVFRRSTIAQLKGFADVDSFLTDRALEFARDSKFKKLEQQSEFEGVFEVLSSVGPEVFRRYDRSRGKAAGAFSIAAFEAITLGVAANLKGWQELTEEQRAESLRSKLPELWTDREFTRSSGAGVRATTRIPRMGSIGARIFAI